jgi:hypothetical protein
MTENFKNSVLKDILEIRQIRHYKHSSEKNNKEYDTKVLRTVECFDKTKSPSEKWNDIKAIKDLHECSLENNYPNIMPINEEWEQNVVHLHLKRSLLNDFTNRPNEVPFFRESVKKILHQPVQTDIFEAKFKSIHEEGKTILTIDDKPVATVILGNIDNKNIAQILRTSLIESDFSENKKHQYPIGLDPYKDLLGSNKSIIKNMNNIANKLLDGDFKNQQEAIDLLLNYKILTSLPYAIQEQYGTQFKNIVKINYLTEAIKKKFPDKIDKNLNIPHVVDYQKYTEAEFLKNPEIAVTLLHPDTFKRVQKRQIAKELQRKSH